VGTRKPDVYGFRKNFKPVMGTGFLMGVNIFHGYEFGIAKPGGFVPVAISSWDGDPPTTSKDTATVGRQARPPLGGWEPGRCCYRLRSPPAGPTDS
jgi:hypothetical protein